MVYRLAECVGSTPLQHLTVAPSMQSLEGSHRVPSISFLLQEGDADGVPGPSSSLGPFQPCKGEPTDGGDRQVALPGSPIRSLTKKQNKVKQTFPPEMK